MMEADFRSLIVSASAITALVPASDIRLNFIPQGASAKAVAIYRVSGVPGYVMDGPDGLEESRIQVDVRCSDPKNAPGSGYSAAFAIAAQIKALLSGFKGTIGGTQFQMIGILAERQSSEDTDTAFYHRFSIDFQVWHRQTS
ncbi:tail completion protein gp17 [Pelagibacterium mangrovi]|uniref:tail completion protein gp17 n=1 Tax=Pelagibacterium mangrovi TaxID=3119828 RepID=UPI002FC88291